MNNSVVEMINENQSEMQYQIRGINFKWEMIAASLIVVVMFLVCIITMWVTYITTSATSIHDISFVRSLLFGAGVSLLLGKLVGKKFSWNWKIILGSEGIKIIESSRIHFFNYKEIEMLHYGGASGRRLLRIKVDDSIKVRISLGTMYLTPFSTAEDICESDRMMDQLEKILTEQNFNLKTINAKTGIFEHTFRQQEKEK